MFERFDHEARQVVSRAFDEAAALGHGYVGTEHLLLALLGGPGGVAAEVLAAAGLTAADVRAALEAEVGPAVTPGDAAALRAIGIDLDEVRAAIEASFGPGALERAVAAVLPAGRRRRLRRRPPRRHRHRRRACPPVTLAGGRPLTPRSKKVLQLALRQSLHLGHDRIGPEHVLLGLLAEGHGLAVVLLVRHGVVPDDLRGRVLAALGRVA